MTDPRRRRYRVRLRKALAGSMFAAAAAASLTGLTAVPALAAPPRTMSASSTVVDDDDAHDFAAPLLADLQLADLPVGGPASAERLAGVRADLDQAVLLRMVTSDQADAFYLQIERRVAAGL
jgi:hypothetical protein